MLGKNDCETCFAKSCIEQGRPQTTSFELNGRIYNVAISPIRDRNGTILSALEVWSDVTGERRLKERLTAQNELLKSDLKMASTLQQSMLPYELKAMEGAKFDMVYYPCEDVGGDFYDVFILDDENVVFYIADVSGHGVSAAMLTVFFSQTVKSIMNTSKEDVEPEEVLRQVWQRFMSIDLQEHLYITAWIGVLNTKTGELKYSNAGHIVAPMMYDGLKISQLEVMGFPVCRWISEPNFMQKKITIPKGGRILLYTDGLSDAWRMLEESREDSTFSTPEKLAESCLKMTNFNEILESIWNGVNFFDYELKLSDDVAMLVVERT
jgi:sigma-B regulation protein RsbU (phosphoserine phosphatase)